MSPLYLGLVHYPVLNKHNEVVQTSVTNLDIHDIARSASTFGLSGYFIITPDASQHEYINKVISFWQSETGLIYNPDRSRALSLITITNSIASGITMITTQEGMQPIVITTTARKMNKQISFEEVSSLCQNNQPVLLLFGTGHGLTDSVHNDVDFVLQPIEGIGDYNHLSVRSAVAIVLDRISSRCI